MASPRGQADYTAIDRWSVLGAGVVQQHPFFPRVMIELETAQGCSRAVTGGCSFCTEPFYGPPRYRSAAGVAAEVGALQRRRGPPLPSTGQRICLPRRAREAPVGRSGQLAQHFWPFLR